MHASQPEMERGKMIKLFSDLQLLITETEGDDEDYLL